MVKIVRLVYAPQNHILSGPVHEAKGKALCGDNARPSVHLYMTWYQRLNRLSDFHKIQFRNSLQGAFQQLCAFRESRNSDCHI
jgi:hypothetical protein